MKRIYFPCARYFHFINCCLKKTIHIIFMMIILMDGNSFAKIITVDDDGPADYASIQEAIDSSSRGDTILVNAGIYNETIVIELEKNISVIGSGAESTIILAQKNNLGQAAVYIFADSIVIKGFTIKCEDIPQYDGIDLYANRKIEVTDNKLINLRYGLVVRSSDHWYIPSYNYTIKIVGNEIADNNVGIYLSPAQPVGQTFEDTVVYDAAENWWGTVDSIDISKGIRNSATCIINYKSWLHQKVEFPVISSTDNGIHRNNIFNNTYRNVYVKGNPTSIKYDNHETSPTFNLFQNYPNPFNPSTTITYQLPKSGNVTLKIFDILGNEVKTLVNEQKEMGRYTVQFSADGGASSLASGMYIYRLRVNDYISTKKMLLLK